jgi:hypothetical protein
MAGRPLSVDADRVRDLAEDGLELRERRAQLVAGPLHFLEGFEGYLQGDAYSGNLTLRKKSPVFMVGCMAHLRRYFVVALEKDPRAAHFIAVIKKGYDPLMFRFYLEKNPPGMRGDQSGKAIGPFDHANAIAEKIVVKTKAVS